MNKEQCASVCVCKLKRMSVSVCTLCVLQSEWRLLFLHYFPRDGGQLFTVIVT